MTMIVKEKERPNMSGHEAEEIIGGWLLDFAANMLIDVRDVPYYHKWHIDFHVVRGDAYSICGNAYSAECKLDTWVAETDNFCFEVGRAYLEGDNDYKSWGFHSKARTMFFYSPQKHKVLVLKKLQDLREWLPKNREKVIHASPVPSRLQHKGDLSLGWEKVGYNWLIPLHYLLDDKLIEWYSLPKAISEYRDAFVSSDRVVPLQR